MNRVLLRQPGLESAWERLPDGMLRRIGTVDIVSGADPIFIGLHDFEQCSFGRSYRRTAHVCFPEHLISHARAERATTLVLPIEETPGVILHELAHVLDQRVGWDRPAISPVGWYAATSSAEAFACGLCAWLAPEWDDGHASANPSSIQADRAAIALFEELAR